MDESSWLTGTDPAAMLTFLRAGTHKVAAHPWGPPSDRKLRLWVEAVAEGAGRWPHNPGPDYGSVDTAGLARLWAATKHAKITFAAKAALLREVVGNPFRPVLLPWGPCVHCGQPMAERVRVPHVAGPCPWLTGLVRGIASAVYEHRDWGALPVLADALEDAGCALEALLRHLRGQETCPDCFDGPEGARVYCHCRGGWAPLRAPHVPGCHAVDLILGKE